MDAKPFDINNYSTLPKGVGITQIKNRKDGMESFLKRDMKELRQEYFNPPQSSASLQSMDQQHLERYLQMQKQKQQTVHWKQRLRQFIDKQFVIQSGNKSLYVWRSRAFEEMMYVNAPRMLFLTGSCYIIYCITLRQQKTKRMKTTVRSHLQEKVDE